MTKRNEIVRAILTIVIFVCAVLFLSSALKKPEKNNDVRNSTIQLEKPPFID